ncbi:ferritin-like domain-containing protein [Neobacillus mesonae]|nr:ferritin-like domain-containing protein [Neobacillus mesonae]
MSNSNFMKWKDYYLHNNQQLMSIPWDEEYRLTAEERIAITSSIQQFQLGEQSEGKHLILQAAEYVKKTGDQDYYDALIEFIREEQRHARELGRFMKQQGITIIKAHWVDGVFRRLRRSAGLELSIIVLVTAEIIAKIYYQALRAATRSPVLITLCDQILQDEVQHVKFQADTMAVLAKNKTPFTKAALKLFHRILLEGTLAVVWKQHKFVLNAGGYRYGDFCRACRAEFDELYQDL